MSGRTRPASPGIALRALVVIALALVSALGAPPLSASADTVRPFLPVFHTQTNGAITITGNTLQACDPQIPDCAATQAAQTPWSNNHFVMNFIDRDNDPSTRNSSSATVRLPKDARVLYAGLFWGAGTVAGDYGANASGSWGQLRLRAPNGTYQTVAASRVDRLSSTVALDYAAYADVTSLVQAGGGGTYWGADISAATGADRYAGWALVVAYEDPTAPLRDLTVFDGYASATEVETVRTSISGFLAPLQGTVNAKIGSVVFEGDRGITGDYFAVNQGRLADAVSPSANFYTSAISMDGTTLTDRNPAYVDSMGIDAKIVDASGLVPNGATSADLAFATNGDFYYPTALTTQIDLYAPTIQGTKTVRNLSGNTPTRVGDTLEYTLTFSNVGEDAATGSQIKDVLPSGTTYVPGSLRIAGAGSQSDAAGDDRAEYNAAAKTVTYRVGAGASTTTGGTLATNASTTVSFRVTVDRAAAGTSLTNYGTLDYRAATFGHSYTYRTADVVTPVAPEADITITKNTPTPQTTAGSQITYTMDVNNYGPSPSQEVVITDTLPTGLTLVSATSSQGSCTASGTTIRCGLGTVPVGAQPTISVIAQIPPGATDHSLTNVATIDASTSDPDPSNNSSAVTVMLAQSADLAVTKSVSPSVPVPGTPVTWTINGVNKGPSTARTVTLIDTIPAGFTNVQARTTAGSCQVFARSVSCSMPSMAPGQQMTVTVTATLSPSYAGGAISNLAEFASATPDPDLTNNTATATATAAPPSADVQIAKRMVTSPVVAGRPVTYQLDISNAGPSTASSVTVTDTLPSTISGVTANPDTGTCSVSSGTLTCAVGSLPPGSTARITITGQLAATASGTVSNTATVSTTTNDPTPGNNSATVNSPIVEQADLALSKSASPVPVVNGSQVTYALKVVNRGPSVARTVTVTDPVPSPLTFVSAATNAGTCAESGGTVTCQVGTLAVGAEATITVTANTAPGGGNNVTNIATVTTSAVDPVSANNTARAALITGEAADISLVKTASSPTVYAGQPVTWTLAVKNNGPSDATTPLTVTDDIPSGVTNLSANGPGGACTVGATSITCPINGLSANASATVTVTGTVSADHVVGDLFNAASVAGGPPDPAPDNNRDTATVSVQRQADLRLTKTGPTTATSGNEITWTLQATNDGPSTAENVMIDDNLPAGTAFVSGTLDTGGTCTLAAGSTVAVLCPAGTLSPGSSATVTLRALIDPDLPSGTTLDNVGHASSNTPDPQPTNDEARFTTTLAVATDLQITKTVAPSVLRYEDYGDYTLRVTNAGPSTARDVVVADDIPAGLTVVLAYPGAGRCTTTGQHVECRVDSLAPGSSIDIDVFVLVDPSVGNSVTNTATVSAPNDTVPGNNSSTITTPAKAVADLVVKKTTRRTEVTAGTGVTYTMTVANYGPSTATGTVLTDRLPDALKVENVSSSMGTCTVTGQDLTCALGDVTYEDTAVITLEATIDPAYGGPLDNTVTVSSPVEEADPTDNTSTARISVVSSAGVAVAKRSNPNTAAAGGEIHYSVIVSNEGPSTARDVVVTDDMPTDLTVLSAETEGTTCTITGQRVSCPIAELPVGQQVVAVRAQLALSYTGTDISNTARATASTPDPKPEDNTSTLVVPVIDLADLAVAKTMTPTNPVAGQQVSYGLTISNRGPSIAVRPQLIDELPPGLTDVQFTGPDGWGCQLVQPDKPGTADNPLAGTVTCSGVSLDPGQSRQATITATVAPGFTGELSNLARVSADTADPVIADNETTVAGTAGTSADVWTTKAITPAEPVAGDLVTFDIQVGNKGPSSARDVTLTDPLPAGLSEVMATTDLGSCTLDDSTGTPRVLCSLGTLAPSQVATVAVRARLDPSFTGRINNQAVAGTSTSDPVPENNIATVGAPTTDHSDVALAKTVDVSQARPGEAVTFTLVATNNGPSTAPSVVVKDTMPESFTSIEATSQDAACTVTGLVVECTAPALAVGSTVTVIVKTVLREGTPPGPVTNTAGVTTTVTDTNPASNVSSVAVAVAEARDLASTGTDLRTSLGIAALLIITGSAALLVARERRPRGRHAA